MPIQWCGNYQKNAPALAASVSVTPSGSANANSNWVTLFTATADSVLTEVISYAPSVATTFFVDIGVDTGGGPVVIATSLGAWWQLNAPGWGRLLFRIPIDAIPSGATVQIRMRKPGTSTAAWRFCCQYIEKPIIGTILTSVNPQQASAFATVTPNNAAWTYGSWTSVHTFSNAAVITGTSVAWDHNYILQLGISSSPILTTHIRGDWQFAYYPLKHPMAVPAGATVQARLQKQMTGTPGVSVGLTYLEL